MQLCKADDLVKNLGQIFIRIKCSIWKSDAWGGDNL